MRNIPNEVKEVLMSDYCYKKNLRIVFPNNERADITEENIIGESMTLDESMCSSNELKFGLSEASCITFTTVGVENIKGMTIRPYLDIELPDGSIYSMPLGQYVVDSCKKQTDMTLRDVVAYSNYINMDSADLSSNFEVDKTLIPSAQNTKYEIDPIRYVFASVSQSLDYDFEKMGINTNYSIIQTLADDTFTIDGFHRIGSVLAIFSIKYKKMPLMNHGEAVEFVVYDTKQPMISEVQINRYLDELVEKYSGGYSSDQNHDGLKKDLFEKCNVFTDISRLSGKLTKHTYSCLKNNGLVDVDVSNSEVKSMNLCIPYELSVEIMGASSGVRSTYDETFSLLDVSKVFVDTLNIGRKYNGLYLPVTSYLVSRKKSNGKYVVDKKDLPSVAKTFKALLELNGLFFVQDRETGKYHFKNLQGASDVKFPDEDTYPSDETYPGESDCVLFPTDYYSAWYDDYEVAAYDRVVVSYKNDLGVDVIVENYIPEYREVYDDALLTFYASPENIEMLFKFTAGTLPDNKRFYFDFGGLMVTAIDLSDGANPKYNLYDDVDVPIDKYLSDIEYLAEYNQLFIIIDMDSVEPGKTYTITVGEYSLEEVEIEHKTLDLSGNYIAENFAISDTYMQNAISNCLANVADVAYIPCEIDLKGMPFLEPGDTITVYGVGDDIFSSIILQRTLTGISGLNDSFKSN